jgi:hypothetical protein
MGFHFSTYFIIVQDMSDLLYTFMFSPVLDILLFGEGGGSIRIHTQEDIGIIRCNMFILIQDQSHHSM